MDSTRYRVVVSELPAVIMGGVGRVRACIIELTLSFTRFRVERIKLFKP